MVMERVLLVINHVLTLTPTLVERVWDKDDQFKMGLKSFQKPETNLRQI